MSHQIVITFDYDEDRIAENAEKEAGRQIAKNVLMESFGADYSRKELMRNYVYKAVREILEPRQEEIVQAAIRDLIDSLRRTKMVKETLGTALEDIEDDGKEGP